jgi:general secretion pathway protein A
MEPMGIEETKRYILYRLKIAGCTRGIFTRQAGQLVHEVAGGIPRNVNRLCELALVTGYGLGEEKIGPEIVGMAAREIGLDGEGEDDAADRAGGIATVPVEAATEEDVLGSVPVPPPEPEEDILAGLAAGELASG